ncbi:hypothetical protein [Planobispora siamensis]|nr:hypothetical protein [Planobispora siamensis]
MDERQIAILITQIRRELIQAGFVADAAPRCALKAACSCAMTRTGAW